LAYNRFRYYSLEEGVYISQDPIGLLGGCRLYGYVRDTNKWVDVLGLTPLFRGTTEGYPGNLGLQQLRITPTSTDPRVATVFATEAATSSGGSGVVIIASDSDLAGVHLDTGGNGSTPSLARIEREVLVDVSPTEFNELASTHIPVDKARAILADMGYDLPSRISSKTDISAILEGLPPMSESEVNEFTNRARTTCNG
jgi:hypothetical protein